MTRDVVVDRLESILNDWKEKVPENVYPSIEGIVQSIPREDVLDFIEKSEQVGKEYGFFPNSPFVLRFLIQLLPLIITSNINRISNLEKACKMKRDGVADRIVILSNHLSYSDANIISYCFSATLQKFGLENDLSVVVGPKVFNQKYKRFASLMFNTLLIAQSQSRATGEASRSPREIARATKKVMKDIKEFVNLLLIFPEGGRSRSTNLMQFLSGVLRLVDVGDNVAILPTAVLGGNKLLPINGDRLYEADVSITIGEPLLLHDVKKKFADDDHKKQSIMDYFGRSVAALLPLEKRGYYS